MQDDEVEFLGEVGSFAIPIYVFNSVVYTICYGMSIPIFIYATNVVSARNLESRAAKVTLTAIIACFLATTVHVGNFIGAGAGQIVIPLLLSRNGATASSVSTLGDKHLFPVNLGSDWSEICLVGLSDAVVIWRASVLFYNKKWVVGILIMLWIGYIATGLAFLCLVSNYQRWYNWRAGLVPLMDRLNEASNYLTLATNAAATLAILFQLWRQRRFFVDVKIHSRSQKILALLVETGAIFCILQLVAFILQHLLDNGSIPPDLTSLIVVDAVQALVYCFSGVYPALVIVLLDAQKSMVDTVYLASVADSPPEGSTTPLPPVPTLLRYTESPIIWELVP